jgi:hypothetical protein
MKARNNDVSGQVLRERNVGVERDKGSEESVGERKMIVFSAGETTR